VRAVPGSVGPARDNDDNDDHISSVARRVCLRQTTLSCLPDNRLQLVYPRSETGRQRQYDIKRRNSSSFTARFRYLLIQPVPAGALVCGLLEDFAACCVDDKLLYTQIQQPPDTERLDNLLLFLVLQQNVVAS